MKLALGIIGIILAAGAVGFGSSLLGWLAIGLLAASLLLRLRERRRTPATDAGGGES